MLFDTNSELKQVAALAGLAPIARQSGKWNGNPIELAFAKLKAHLKRMDREQSQSYGKPLEKYVICSLQRNAKTSSKQTDMTLVKPEML